MKTIAFLIDNINHVGGTERVTALISNCLSMQYHIIIISAKGQESCFYSLKDTIEVISLNAGNVHNRLLRKLYISKQLFKLVKSKYIDCIIAVDIAMFIYLIPIALTKQTKTIAWEHFNYFYHKNIISKITQQLAIILTDKIVVLGKTDLENYQSHSHQKEKIIFIYNPIEFPNIIQPFSQREKIVLSIGRLTKQKGFDILLNIWKEIESEMPEWALVIVGEGPEKQHLQEIIEQEKLKHVCIAPFTKNIAYYYQKASVYALSSRYEGFVLVLLEAQSYMLPCISFMCPCGPTEIIANEENGYLIDENNIEDYINKLLFLMKHEEIRYQFSQKATKDLDRFRIENIVSKWDQLFDELFD